MERADGHRYYEGLAVAHVLGGLDDSEGQVFRAHLLECVDCRARVGELRAIAHDLADVERDERRVRAAQAIDTKRRDAEDTDEEAEEAPEPTRASRISVIVGLVLVIGLSLWNFTLRGELTALQRLNDGLREARVIEDHGKPWRTTIQAEDDDVEATFTEAEGQLVANVSGLDPDQAYGLYMIDDDDEGVGTPMIGWKPSPNGGWYQLIPLAIDADKVLITDPYSEGNSVGTPGPTPRGKVIISAER